MEAVSEADGPTDSRRALEGFMQVKIRGVVLAGVHAWRDSTFEQVVPAPLVPVAGRPLIGYSFDWLRDHGVRRVSVCANSDTDTIRNSLGDGKRENLNVEYYEDHMPRGPAGCVRDAAIGSDDDTFVVVSATVIPYHIDLSDLLRAHDESQAALTVVTCRVGPDTDHRPAGVYIFSSRALRYVPDVGYQDIKESLIPQLHRAGERVQAYRIDKDVPRVSGADACLTATAWVLELAATDSISPPGFRRTGEALVHESAELDSSAMLIGPVTIGPRSRVDAGATVVGPATIDADCVVESGALVSRSALWDGSHAGSNGILDRCILTFGARTMPGMVQTARVCN